MMEKVGDPQAPGCRGLADGPGIGVPEDCG